MDVVLCIDYRTKNNLNNSPKWYMFSTYVNRWRDKTCLIDVKMNANRINCTLTRSCTPTFATTITNNESNNIFLTFMLLTI